MSQVGTVIVTATARLHLGFLDLAGGLGRRFGSMGLSLDGPATRLSLARAPAPTASGPDSERAASHLCALRDSLGLVGAYALTIHEAIPAHVGMGSGTTLALAVGAALRRLEGLPAGTRADARLLARGERSGIGIAGFDEGGFIVDGGRGEAGTEPPVVARLPFPDDWRVLLVEDGSRRGLHGAEERAAFAALAPFPEADADRICRLVLVRLLPALAEADIAAFGAAVLCVQEMLGTYFAPAQGGERFTSREVGAALALLHREGAHGIGQSSWGPTGFAFAANPGEAERLAGALRRAGLPAHVTLSIRRGLNRGARIGFEARQLFAA